MLRSKLTVAVTALALAATTLVAVTPADAQWRGRGGYHHHRGGGWGGGGAVLGGLAAGAIIGGALAAQRPYGYYEPGYAYSPGYGGDTEAYCMQRFKSYDPGSGTYLGYDGRRHPCP